MSMFINNDIQKDNRHDIKIIYKYETDWNGSMLSLVSTCSKSKASCCNWKSLQRKTSIQKKEYII